MFVFLFEFTVRTSCYLDAINTSSYKRSCTIMIIIIPNLHLLHHFSTMEESSSIVSSVKGLRKGAWAEEEDLLLRKCIIKYGEGKWRQVPIRAGLNRCRKSCRLRWLNYLQPNIKRGEFQPDEVDLIIRMHKLLGNRQVHQLLS
ncbi:hypothetical protein C5167_027813 [Papaver somniferum]|nr:hypothetical protein C5167_004069 [Papaver somniferum]RZC91748.1 hypothetical protein C5167_027813 [Papaver somniferum]